MNFILRVSHISFFAKSPYACLNSVDIISPALPLNYDKERKKVHVFPFLGDFKIGVLY